ncbi:pseudouridine synthase [Sphingomonas sp. A2-49]|uniref:pseudouridine synthase n=1 Tax=Sphingomonas sp. A2-49 TaxID=1391375 RepID=UPI0021D37602|nr:pseudouridine synthase [Sphingomonas sp. A2-49]MCU6452902.1 pseudouridine synthase [Sphingomonas sp. A2-49]
MAQTQEPRTGDRIAKLLARAGVASRREVERMIDEGRVALNGKVLDTPATVLKSLQGVTVDGQPVALPEPTRLFLYHKPTGLLVTERDPKGRTTIYDRLPHDLPRLVPVGRLDLNTEGLLLLTTDGGFKRQLELPSTGVERSYRARAYGNVTQQQLEALAEGVEIEGIRYGSIDANIERRTGANVWIEITITEGKNREVRRVLEHLGLQVSRLIRTRYGPFVLGDLPVGGVGEVKQHEVVAFRRTLKGGAPDEPPMPDGPRDGFRTAPTVDRTARVRTRADAPVPQERPARPRVEPEGRRGARPARATAAVRPPRADRAEGRPAGAGRSDDRAERPARSGSGFAGRSNRGETRTVAAPRSDERGKPGGDRSRTGDRPARAGAATADPRGDRGAGRAAFAARADERSRGGSRAERGDDRPARPPRGNAPTKGPAGGRGSPRPNSPGGSRPTGAGPKGRRP